jgi:S-adenosylmethionine/arginine decarboxylase-like enzyme
MTFSTSNVVFDCGLFAMVTSKYRPQGSPVVTVVVVLSEPRAIGKKKFGDAFSGAYRADNVCIHTYVVR